MSGWTLAAWTMRPTTAERRDVQHFSVMSHLAVVPASHVQNTTSDPHDRALVRHMLTLTPAERLRNLSNYWPLIRVGLQQRELAGGQRP